MRDQRLEQTIQRIERALARIVADYIAGMTDRFAIETHSRFIGGTDTRSRLLSK